LLIAVIRQKPYLVVLELPLLPPLAVVLFAEGVLVLVLPVTPVVFFSAILFLVLVVK
jgi:hypothetical protein